MNLLAIVMLVFGASGWFIHLVFIAYAIANKGVIEIDYNHYKEMYIELVIMIFIFILTIYALIIF
jgi:hypothetical protein